MGQVAEFWSMRHEWKIVGDFWTYFYFLIKGADVAGAPTFSFPPPACLECVELKQLQV